MKPILDGKVSSPHSPPPQDAHDISSINLHQQPNCVHSTYKYYGETRDDVPHGVGIRIYSNSGISEKGEFSHGVFQCKGEYTCADYVHRGSFFGGVAHGLGIRQWVHFPQIKDVPGIILSRRHQMNGTIPFESEQVELAIRSAVAAADPTNIAKQNAKCIAAERESELRRKIEADFQRRRLEEEALALSAQHNASSKTSSSCVMF